MIKKSGLVYHPRLVFLPEKNAVPGSVGAGRLYIQRRQDKQEFPPGMSGQPVRPYPQQGQADGAVMGLL